MTYACRPFDISLFSWFRTWSISSCLAHEVKISFLPLGICLIEVTSISPNAEIDSVLGIGVAVINKTFVSAPFSRNFLRWFTPNRCCSSMITNPISLNATSSCISACVPTITSTSPASNCSSNNFLFLPLTELVNKATFNCPPNNSSKLIACCSANIAVGTISALCLPALNIA